MGINYNLNELPQYSIFLLVGAILLSFFGPYLFLFEFQPALFSRLEPLKLILLCTAIGIPSLILLSIVFMSLSIMFSPEQQFEDYIASIGLLWGTLGIMIAFCLPCVITFAKPISFNSAVLIALISASGLALSVGCHMYLDKKDERKQKEKELEDEKADRHLQ
jgi:hypothetical protein